MADEYRPAGAFEGLTVADVLRGMGRRAAELGEAIPRQVAQNYTDLDRLLQNTPQGLAGSYVRSKLKKALGADTPPPDPNARPSFEPAPFAQHSSNPAVQAGAMLLDPLNFVGGALAAGPLARKAALKARFPKELVKHTDQKMREVAENSLKAKGVGNITEQDINHEIARHNASLPEKKGGLGLPEDNTAEQRAEALGFGDELYHGSLSGNIKAFNPSTHGSDSSFAGRGVYASSEPGDASVNYASAHGGDPSSKIIQKLEERGSGEIEHGTSRTARAFYEKKLSPERLEKVVRGTEQGDSLGVVYPVRMRERTVVDMDARPGEGPRLNEGLTNYDEAAEEYGLTAEGESVQRALARQLSGSSSEKDHAAEVFSGVAFEDEPYALNDLRRSIARRVNEADVYDMEGLPISGSGVATDAMRELGVDALRHQPKFSNPMLNMADYHQIALDPKNVRSRFAAFDPARKHHSDMLGFTRPGVLATLAAGTGGYMAFPALSKALREYRDKAEDALIDLRRQNREPPMRVERALRDAEETPAMREYREQQEQNQR